MKTTFMDVRFLVFTIFVQSTQASQNSDKDDTLTFNHDSRQVYENKIDELTSFNKLKDLLSRYINNDKPNNTKTLKNIALALKGFQDHFDMKLDTNITDGLRNSEILPSDAIAGSIKLVEKLLVENPKMVPESMVMDIILKPFFNPNQNTTRCCNETVLHVIKLIQQHYNNYKANIAKCETSNNTLPANIFGENQYFLGSFREKLPFLKELRTLRPMLAYHRHNARNWLLYYIRRNNDNIEKRSVERSEGNTTFAALNYCEQIAIQDFLEFVKILLQRKVREIRSTCNKITCEIHDLDCEENILREMGKRNLRSAEDDSKTPIAYNQFIILRRNPKLLLWESIEAVTDVAVKEILKKLLEEESKDIMLLIKEILVRWLLKKLKDPFLDENDKKSINNRYYTTNPFKNKENNIVLNETENISFWKRVVTNLSKEEATKVLTLLLQHADVQSKVVSILKNVVGRDLSVKMQSALNVYNLLSRKSDNNR